MRERETGLGAQLANDTKLDDLHEPEDGKNICYQIFKMIN